MFQMIRNKRHPTEVPSLQKCLNIHYPEPEFSSRTIDLQMGFHISKIKTGQRVFRDQYSQALNKKIIGLLNVRMTETLKDRSVLQHNYTN